MDWIGIVADTIGALALAGTVAMERRAKRHSRRAQQAAERAEEAAARIFRRRIGAPR